MNKLLLLIFPLGYFFSISLSAYECNLRTCKPELFRTYMNSGEINPLITRAINRYFAQDSNGEIPRLECAESQLQSFQSEFTPYEGKILIPQIAADAISGTIFNLGEDASETAEMDLNVGGFSFNNLDVTELDLTNEGNTFTACIRFNLEMGLDISLAGINSGDQAYSASVNQYQMKFDNTSSDREKFCQDFELDPTTGRISYEELPKNDFPEPPPVISENGTPISNPFNISNCNMPRPENSGLELNDFEYGRYVGESRLSLRANTLNYAVQNIQNATQGSSPSLPNIDSCISSLNFSLHETDWELSEYTDKENSFLDCVQEICRTSQGFPGCSGPENLRLVEDQLNTVSRQIMFGVIQDDTNSEELESLRRFTPAEWEEFQNGNQPKSYALTEEIRSENKEEGLSGSLHCMIENAFKYKAEPIAINNINKTIQSSLEKIISESGFVQFGDHNEVLTANNPNPAYAIPQSLSVQTSVHKGSAEVIKELNDEQMNQTPPNFKNNRMKIKGIFKSIRDGDYSPELIRELSRMRDIINNYMNSGNTTRFGRERSNPSFSFNGRRSSLLEHINTLIGSASSENNYTSTGMISSEEIEERRYNLTGTLRSTILRDSEELNPDPLNFIQEFSYTNDQSCNINERAILPAGESQCQSGSNPASINLNGLTHEIFSMNDAGLFDFTMEGGRNCTLNLDSCNRDTLEGCPNIDVNSNPSIQGHVGLRNFKVKCRNSSNGRYREHVTIESLDYSVTSDGNNGMLIEAVDIDRSIRTGIAIPFANAIAGMILDPNFFLSRAVPEFMQPQSDESSDNLERGFSIPGLQFPNTQRGDPIFSSPSSNSAGFCYQIDYDDPEFQRVFNNLIDNLDDPFICEAN